VSEANGTPTTARRTTKRRSILRFEILNAFVDEGMARLTPCEAVVWLVLYRDTKPDGVARTAVDEIARRAGIGRRTVLRALRRLEELRMVKVVRRGGLNRGASSYRAFPFPAPDEWG
jgi:DNA-binding transcriptional ArsR family regulator